ncbi:MAG: hypothetical protein ACRYFL_15980 [Janthinobacterium lividum]
MQKLLLIVLLSFIWAETKAQTSPAPMPKLEIRNPWKINQLIEPAELAAIIQNPQAQKPLILNIGAVEDIKDATHIGPANKTENLEILMEKVKSLSKNTAMVIYCGCCPFGKCPNIRPAFTALQNAGFSNVKLLNLPVNLNTNWTSKGYPLAGK